MRRIIPGVVSLVLILSLVGAAAFSGAVAADTKDNSADEIAPGERFNGVLGVVDAELEGEIAERSFGITIAKAASEDAKAEALAGQLGNVEDRLSTLEERKAALNEQREAGEITEGKYQAEIAKLAIETNTAERLANASEEVAGGLPDALLESKGINVSAIQTLKDRADELSGPEVAEIARSIAGESERTPIGPDRDGIPPVEIPGQPDSTDDDLDEDDSDVENDHEDVEEQIEDNEPEETGDS